MFVADENTPPLSPCSLSPISGKLKIKRKLYFRGTYKMSSFHFKAHIKKHHELKALNRNATKYHYLYYFSNVRYLCIHTIINTAFRIWPKPSDMIL